MNKLNVLPWLSTLVLVGSGCGDGEWTGSDEVENDTGDTEEQETEEEIDTTPGIELCDDFDELDVMDGEYRAHNNIWRADEEPGEQCIEVKENSFEITLSTLNLNQVASYPFLLKGCHLGRGECTVDSGMPIRVSDINTCRFTWEIDTTTADGTWNAAYESWFGGTGAGAELMVWIDHYGSGAVPDGARADETVEIEGHTWHVWQTPVGESSWRNYIAYIINDPIARADFDFTRFIDDAIERGAVDPESELQAMEAGFEIWRDGEGLRTISYTAHVD
jgi:hypothetical protein